MDNPKSHSLLLQLGVAGIAGGILALCSVRWIGAMEAPRLVVTPLVVDFGEVQTGVRKTMTVKLRNTGRRPLIIKEVRPDCSCISVQMATNHLKGGEVTDLVVTITGDNRSRTNEVMVISNDNAEPIQQIVLSQKGSERVFLDPPAIDFGTINGSSDEKTRSVFLRAYDPALAAKININDLFVRVSGRWMDCAVKQDAENQRIVIQLTLKATMPAGEFSEHLTVADSTGRFVLTGAIRGYIASRLLLRPSPVVVGAVDDDKSVAGVCRLIPRSPSEELVCESLELDSEIDELVVIGEVKLEDYGVLHAMVMRKPRLARNRWLTSEVRGCLFAHLRVAEDEETVAVPIVVIPDDPDGT